MPDETTGATTQADDAAESQADASRRQQSQADNDRAQAAQSISLEEARKLRKEAQQLRKANDDLAAKIKASDDAKLSETERLKKELDEVKQREATWAKERRERDTRDTALEALSSEKVGARNPRALYKLLRDELETDDQGRLTNLDALLKSARTEYPEQFGKAVGSADAGAGARQTGGAPDMNSWIRQVAGRG